MGTSCYKCLDFFTEKDTQLVNNGSNNNIGNNNRKKVSFSEEHQNNNHPHQKNAGGGFFGLFDNSANKKGILKDSSPKHKNKINILNNYSI